MTAAGAGADAFWDAFRAGRSLLGPLKQVDRRGLAVDRGAEVADRWLELEGRGTPPDRAERMAALAIGEALQRADLLEGSRVGLALGTALGPVQTLETVAAQGDTAAERWGDVPLHRLTRALVERFGLGGPRWTFSVTCVSGLYALEQAIADLLFDRADAVLCGGLDTLSLFMQSGFCSLRALSRSGQLKPFSPGHDGIVLGEGAAFVVLERLDRAHSRRAKVFGTLAGMSLVSDGTHLTSPDSTGEGMATAIRCALADSGVAADEIGCITPTATGSPVYDLMQSRAVLDVFGEGGAAIPVTTWELIVGHALASTGVLGLVHSALVLDRGEVLPTRGVEAVAEGCRLRYVLEDAAPFRGEAVLALTVGFGGQNGVTVLRREGSPAAIGAVESAPAALRREVVVLGSAASGQWSTEAGVAMADSEGVAQFPIDPESLAAAFPNRWNPRRELPVGMEALVKAFSAALIDAGWWSPGGAGPIDGGLVLGTDYYSVGVASRYAAELATSGPAGISPADFLFSLPSSPAAILGILFGLKSYQATLTSGDDAGFDALGHACDVLTLNRVKRLAVGALTIVEPGFVSVLERLGHGVLGQSVVSGSESSTSTEMAVAFCLELEDTDQPDVGPGSENGTAKHGAERAETAERTLLARESAFGRGEEARDAKLDETRCVATREWLEDLPPVLRSLAAPSLLALLRASGEGAIRVVHPMVDDRSSPVAGIRLRRVERMISPARSAEETE